jgi:uncharacterized protein
LAEEPALAESGAPIALCRSCGLEIAADARYCQHCGAKIDISDSVASSRRSKLIWLVSLFFGVQLLLGYLVRVSDNLELGVAELIVLDIFFSLVTVMFAGFGWRQIWPSLTLRNSSIIKAAFYVLIAAGVMDWVNHNIFETEIVYFEAFNLAKYPLLWMMLSLAVQPALFEELGFRGLMQGTLNNLLDKPQSMTITAFAFAAIHLNLISLIWLMPFGLMLGYVRMREGTIWYGVIMHFVFNAIAVLNDLPEYYPVF